MGMKSAASPSQPASEFSRVHCLHIMRNISVDVNNRVALISPTVPPQSYPTDARVPPYKSRAFPQSQGFIPVYSNWDLIAEVQSGAVSYLETGRIGAVCWIAASNLIQEELPPLFDSATCQATVLKVKRPVVRMVVVRPQAAVNPPSHAADRRGGSDWLRGRWYWSGSTLTMSKSLRSFCCSSIWIRSAASARHLLLMATVVASVQCSRNSRCSCPGSRPRWVAARWARV